MQNMEVTGWNIRECSVHLSRCDFSSSRSAARLDSGVPAAPHAFTPPVASCAAGYVQECATASAMVMKMEDDDKFTIQKSDSVLAHLSKDSVNDFSWCIKEENGFLVKTEDEALEVMVKQELDIGPTVLQPPSAPRAQADLEPLLGTSSAIVTVKVEPCEVFNEPALRNFSEVSFDTNFVLNMSTANVSKISKEPSDSEDTSQDTEDDSKFQAPSGSDCKKDITKTKANICECSKLNAISQSGSENTEEKPYKCKQCENVASRPRKIKVIMRCQTRRKPYKCEQCRYSTPHVSHLKRHMRVHTGERPYKCKQCKYSASEIDSLKRHLRTHTGEKPFECKQCTYTTSHISHLKRHMCIHTGEKPYKCHQCSYSASEIGSLKRHVRIHTGEKPYKCNRCEYSAAELGSVKRHFLTHTSEKPYKCQQCKYSATQSGNLKIHMRTHVKKEAQLENTHAHSRKVKGA